MFISDIEVEGRHVQESSGSYGEREESPIVVLIKGANLRDLRTEL